MKVRLERSAEKTFMCYLSHDSAGKKIFTFYRVGNGKSSVSQFLLGTWKYFPYSIQRNLSTNIPRRRKNKKQKTKTRQLEWGLKPRECQSNFSQHDTQQMITSGAAGAKASALWTSSWAILAQPLKPFALPIMPQKFQAASDTTLKDSAPQELNCASSSLQPEPWK